jgi:hypothetical protein
MEEVSIKKFKIQRLEKMRMDPNCGPSTMAVIGKRNTGKCLAQGTKIVMYNGDIKEVEKVKIGDFLMGPDSLPRKVESLAEGRELLFKVCQEPYGKDYIVNASHILTLYVDGIIKDIPIKRAVKMKKEIHGIKASKIEFKVSRTIIKEPYRLGKIYSLKQPIPNEIMKSRSNIRLQYLYGILDSNSIQLERSQKYRFKRNITEPLRNLANSLGMYCDKNNIRISDTINHFPITIKPHKFGKYYGFTLSDTDPDRRFLLEDFTITHNTYMVKDIMYTMRNIPCGILMCKSAGGREAFSEVFPSTFIYDDVELDMIEKMHSEKQNSRTEHGSDLKKSKKTGKPYDYSSILIMDDCSSGNVIRNSKEIDKLIYNGRHAKMFFLYSFHDVVNMKPSQRKNLDFVFIARTPGIEDRRKIWREWFSIVPKFSDFCDLMNMATDNFGYLVFDNTMKKTETIQNTIFYYRARSPPPKYRFGSGEFWKVHEESERAKKKMESKKKHKKKFRVQKAEPRKPEN